MSELGEAPPSSTPILDRLEANQRAFELGHKQIQPKNMLSSVQNVMGLKEEDITAMLGTNNPDKISTLIKKDGPNYPQVRNGFLTSSYLLFNVRPEHTDESWIEYINRPRGDHGGKSIKDRFLNGEFEEILEDFERPIEEEQAA